MRLFTQSLILWAVLLIADRATAATGPTPFSRNVTFVSAGANLFAAKTASPWGTTIFVGAGHYGRGVTNLLKNCVNWDFMAGAVVSNGFSGNVCAIFDNSSQGTPGAITSIVAGAGVFIDNNGGSDGLLVNGMLNIYDSGSRIKFQCRELRNDSDNGGSASHCAIFVADCSLLELDIDWVNVLSPAPPAVYWENGTARGRIGHINGVAGSGLYSSGAGPADWVLTVDTIFTPSSTAIYFIPTHNENKLWVKNIWTYGGSAGGIDYGAAITVWGGKLYYESQKLWGNWGGVSDTGPIIHQQGGLAWIKTMKMSITNNQDFIEQEAGYMRIECKDWEDNLVAGGTRPYCNLISGGTNEMSGNAFTRWGPFMKLTGGQLYMERMRVNTFSQLAHSNNCLYLIGTGVPILDNCTFIPGSIFSVSNASAGDLRINGILNCKSNITATLTARGGTVDHDTFHDR